MERGTPLGASIKPLFTEQSSLGLRSLVATLAVVGLITADLRFNSLTTTRSVLDMMVGPVYWLADIPARVLDWGNTNISSRGHLLEENEKLGRENLILEGRSHQMAALRAENMRLRSLLNSAAMLQDDVLVAELIGISPDPMRHQLVLNKGVADRVYVGQPLIDADGMMGQVIAVSEYSSRALLITDATHSIPVQINRNGVRAIAEGTGALATLEVRHIASTTDIEEGDLLVTSGLGGRFPAGYPVAVVSKIERDPGQSFARIEARPSAALDRSRYVLLVFTAQSSVRE